MRGFDITEHWFSAARCLSQIFISMILISKILICKIFISQIFVTKKSSSEISMSKILFSSIGDTKDTPMKLIFQRISDIYVNLLFNSLHCLLPESLVCNGVNNQRMGGGGGGGLTDTLL